MPKLPQIVYPKELKKVFEMENNSPITGMTETEEKYSGILKLLFSKRNLQWPNEDHLNILHLLLLIEHYHKQEELKRYSLKNQKPVFNKNKKYFEISVPDLDEEDPFVTEYDDVLLDKEVLKIIEIRTGSLRAVPYM